MEDKIKKRDNLYKSCNFNIKDLYVSGYNAKEIADELGCKHPNVQKYIQRNLKEFKDNHMILNQFLLFLIIIETTGIF